MSKSKKDMLFFSLEAEYGYILEKLKDLKSFEITKVNMCDIHPNNDIYFRKVCNCNFDIDYDDPIAFCVEGSNDTYKIIDGYHRYTIAKKDNKRKVKIVLGK
ncbi:MAG: hypothetical protein ACOCUI_00175 [bacterium]